MTTPVHFEAQPNGRTEIPLGEFTVVPVLTGPVPDSSREAARLAELARLNILDTAPEARFDRIVALARLLFDAPGATMSLIDTDRQWLKSRSGMGITSEAAREISFCNHVVQNDRSLIVSDAKQDERFSGNPLVEGPPYIRFYAGAPIRTDSGVTLGALCILSPEPRAEFSRSDQRRLEALAGVVVNELELRLRSRQREQEAQNKVSDIQSHLNGAYLRIRNKMEYSELIADIQSGELSVPKISALAIAAWEQHLEADSILSSSIRSLRDRMTPSEYKDLLKAMPGFAI
jgi:GAF domain-containing protein